MCRLTFWALGAVCLVVLTEAYKEGPPVTGYANICQSMFPEGHCASTGESGESDSHEDMSDSHSHEEGQTDMGCYGNETTMAKASGDASPFDFIAPDCYKEDTDIYVKINVKAAMAEDYYFEGIFVQARLVNNDNDSYGVFSTSDTELQTLNCFSKTANALGHSSAAHYGCKNFKWRAPASFKSTIEFVATVVKGESTFWIDLKTGPLTYMADCNATTTASDDCPADTSGASQPLPVGIVMATLSAILVFVRF